MVLAFAWSSFLLLVYVVSSTRATASATATAWSLFPPSHIGAGNGTRRFIEERLIDAGSLGLPTQRGLVAAWVDWNADQHLDAVLLSSDQSTLSISQWNPIRYAFEPAQEGHQVAIPQRDGSSGGDDDWIVVNVVPGDYDFDGRVDLLVMMTRSTTTTGGGGWWGHHGGDSRDATVRLVVYLQQPDGSLGQPIALDDAATAGLHPIPLDANGDMRTDLLGYVAVGSDAQSDDAPPQLKLWRNTGSATTDPSRLFELYDPPLDLSSHPTGQFTCHPPPAPHFDAFIDLDGDCLADLFLTCLEDPNRPESSAWSYQIWTNDKDKGKFVFKREGKLPKGVKGITFADMDRDGTIDLVVTSCPNPRAPTTGCHLSILYNHQIPLCDSTVPESDPCRDPEALCTADPDFHFSSPDDRDSTAFSVVVEDLMAATGSGGESQSMPRHLVTSSKAGFRGAPFPIVPQVGDFNIDGYPDLLIVTTSSSSSRGGGDKRASILESVPCAKGVPGCSEVDVKNKGRGFRVVGGKGAEALDLIRDVESASWVDLGDDGTLDILVQRSANSGAARTLTFVKNNYFHDAFFLKAQVLNGACQGWCEPRPGTDEERYRPFGSSYSGASFKFTVLDPTGARRSTQYAQLPQTSYMSLSPPYSYCGLGRTNNYLENLFVGSTRHQPRHYINIEGLIPNSQVLINPYQPEGSDDPASWTKMLYLRPGEWIPWVTVVLLAAIVALGIVVIVLHVREKRQDEAERRARLLSLNFQAL